MEQSLNSVSQASANAKKKPFRDRLNEIQHKKENERIWKPKTNSSCIVKSENVNKILATKFDENVLYEVQRVSSSGLKLLFKRVVSKKPAINETISKTVNPKAMPALSIRHYVKRIRTRDCQLFFPTSDKKANEFISQTFDKEPETSSANRNLTANGLLLKSTNTLHVTDQSDVQNKMEKILARLKAEREAKLMEKVIIYRAQLIEARTPC